MGTESPFIAWLLSAYATAPWVGLLLAMMVVDVFSGVAASIYERKLSSKVGYKGAMKKCSIIIVVFMAYLMEQQIIGTVPAQFRNPDMAPLAKISAGFFLFNEALSVLENAKRCGVPLPAFLSKSLIETINKISNYGASKATETVKFEMTAATMEGTIKHENQQPTPPPLILPEETKQP